MKKKSLVISIIIIVVIIAGVFIFFAFNKNSKIISYQTVKVTRGTVCNTITATGTIQAIKTVEVGTQVSGVISKIYVDFNSQVTKGELLAELDRRPLLSNLENAQASFENAKAEVSYQKSNYERIKNLYDKKLVAQTDYDLALYNYSKAQASLKIATSEFDKAKVNLDYANIYSPIEGVILERAVDEGQTVAASFSTPTLFTIAHDLTQMQVEASIDEADIGQIRNNQKVKFTVDAFPDLKFNGEVIEIRLQPVTKSNVVTYTVIVKAPNPDKKLLPGMTANLNIIIEEAQNVLIVPSKVLRFTPDSKDFQGLEFNNNQSIVWMIKGNSIHPVPIQIGLNDELNVNVLSGLKEGEEVVFAVNNLNEKTSVTDTTESSPFMPKGPPKKKN